MSSQKIFSSQIEIITPKKAKEYLSKNASTNRKVGIDAVKKYAEDMKNGEWSLTHQGIAFDKQGTLIDGQHRLLAVIQSGVSVMMQVSRGVDDSAFRDIDSGKARKAADQISIAYGHVYTTHEVAIIRQLASYKLKRQLSPAQFASLLSKHKKNIYTLTTGAAGLRTAPTAAAISAYILSGGSHEVAREFREVFISGITTKPSHALIIELRDFMLAGKHHKKSSGDGQRRDVFIITCIMIDRFSKGKKTKKIPDAKEPMPFDFEL